jgi:hypothetical protein
MLQLSHDDPVLLEQATHGRAEGLVDNAMNVLGSLFDESTDCGVMAAQRENSIQETMEGHVQRPVYREATHRISGLHRTGMDISKKKEREREKERGSQRFVGEFDDPLPSILSHHCREQILENGLLLHSNWHGSQSHAFHHAPF